jgi:hypothetical protein
VQKGSTPLKILKCLTGNQRRKGCLSEQHLSLCYWMKSRGFPHPCKSLSLSLSSNVISFSVKQFRLVHGSNRSSLDFVYCRLCVTNRVIVCHSSHVVLFSGKEALDLSQTAKALHKNQSDCKTNKVFLLSLHLNCHVSIIRMFLWSLLSHQN